MTLSKQEEMLTKGLDVLESAISDENHALAICSREEIWKIVYRMIDLALAERDREVVEVIKGTIKKSDTRSNQWWKDEGKRDIINLITNK